jgi:thioredoxin 1
MAKPLEISDSSFQSEVIDSDQTVLVDFWAPWCGPCRMVGPILEEIAAEQDSRIKIVKLNVDENQQYAGQFEVFNIPTMILFKGGKQVDKIVGAVPKNQLLDRLTPYLPAAGEESDQVIAL